MTSTLESLPAPERVIVPCRLIFWGIIICLLDINLGNFDTINDFVGMLMLLYGVAALYAVPISHQYRQWMAFPLILTIFGTLFSFFGDVVLPLSSTLQTPPNKIILALFILVEYLEIMSIIVFCRCMGDYCMVMNWERVRTSWRYSAQLITYGVLILYVILAIPKFFFISALTFFYIGSLPPNINGVQFHSDIGYWRASIDATVGYTVILLILLVGLVLGIWAFVHFLISLSRMIYAAEKSCEESEGNTV